MTGKLVVVAWWIFIVWPCFFVAFGKVEASEADEHGAQVTSPANASYDKGTESKSEAGK